MDRPARARTWSGAGASRTCSRPAGGSTTRPTTRRCCGCRARCARSRSRSCAPTARGSRRWSTPSWQRERRRPAGRRPDDGVRRDRPPPLRAGAAARRGGASRRSRQQLQRSLLAGSAAGDAGARARRRLPPGRQRPRGRRRLVRRVLARRRRGASALVVGDVVGRGIDAAATMGQLRSAVRALASTGLGPGALLDGARRVRRAATTSARWRPWSTPSSTSARGRLRYACAGHPPPADPRAGRGAALRLGRPLARRSTRYRPMRAARRGARARSRPAATRAALHRRPDRAPHAVADGGHGPAARGGGGPPATTPAALVAALVRRLRDAEHPDDVCLLAARV